MSVTVWTMPTTAVALPLPLLYAKGTSTQVSGGCLLVLDAADKQIAVWGAGAWERVDISG